MIDASLFQLLTSSGLYVRGAAEAIIAMLRDGPACENGNSIWLNVGDKTFIVEPDDDGLPIISTLVDV